MAKLSGILKIEGTLQDMTFYKTQDGHLVKTKGGVSGDRIANDPAFVRTRENGSEFGNAASAGKLLRNTVRTLIKIASDNRVTSRLTQIMTSIKNYDATSVRGERSVGVGIADPAAQEKLKNFNFNKYAILSCILHKPYTVNTTTGVIDILGFLGANDVDFPVGATHVTLSGAWAKVDFAGYTSDIQYTNSVNVAIGATSPTDVTLTPADTPSGSGINIFMLLVEFFQEINGVQYSLNNGAYNSFAVIEVAENPPA